ncbi:MAG TPA: helix-turn-helix domain-containing protein [Candidatus Elarobacter sp.]|nr:helix-turn-helix domain-containing protein [Candidatus Elarobacter sp.]
MNPETAPAFGELLRRYRLAAGLSQGQLADLARVSVAAVSALERGTRRAPQRQTLALLAEALALDAGELAALDRTARRSRVRSRSPSKSLTEFAGARLPTYRTSFVARERDVAEVRALVAERRLATIVGAGGIGKTRLACAAATALGHRFDSVAFIDLTRITDPEHLRLQMASMLGITEAQPQNAVERIATVLDRGRNLLVLDNCEHILDGLVPFTDALLQRTNSLHVLATSRERLRLDGEQVYRLQPLALGAALDLFVERAQEADRGFALAERLRSTALDIVRRLDGIPLAIELGAAHLPGLGLPELRRRIDRQLASPGASRGAPARQQTMQATIAWSYALLEPHQQIVLARLAIFVGGATLEAAEIVCSCDRIVADEIATIIPQLVERSVVQLVPDETPRYRLLEPVRLFGIERLIESGTYDILVFRHAAWLADMADACHHEISSGPSRTIARGILPDLDNIRAALDRLLATNDAERLLLAARIAGGFRTIWIVFDGGYAEGHRWSTRILDRLDEDMNPELYGRVFRLYFQTTRSTDEERSALQHAAELFSRIGDRSTLRMVYANLIQLLTACRHDETAARWVEVSRPLLDDAAGAEHPGYVALAAAHAYFFAEQRDFPRAHANMELAERILGKPGESDRTLAPIKAEIFAMEGDYEQAVAIAQCAVAQEPAGYHWTRVLRESGVAAYRFLAGDLAAAASAVRRILLDAPSNVEEAFAFDATIAVAGAIVAARGQLEVAARLTAYAGASEVWREFLAGGRLARERLETALTSGLARERYAPLAAEGRRLTRTEAMQLALATLDVGNGSALR